MGYPGDRKEAILKKMRPPSNKPVEGLAQEEGIPEAAVWLCKPERV